MRRAFAVTAAVLLCLTPTPAVAQSADRQLLHEDYGSYPRLIRTQHGHLDHNGRILATMTSTDEAGFYAPVYESTDEGRSFHQVGEVRDPEGRYGSGMCCGTLYELPRSIGQYPKGTLLWAASYRQKAPRDTRRIGIRIWASTDTGRSWDFAGEPVTSYGPPGVWEPEFDVDDSGTLQMHYADERGGGEFDQFLTRRSSDNLVDWSDPAHTLTIPPWEVRPGMPITARLPDGRHYFSYEICNFGERFCDPYFKISDDGEDFGDPTDPGTQVATPEGRHFRHSPTISPFPGGPNGTRMLLIGQIYADADGTPNAGNGKTILANDDPGSGEWYEVPAPVEVADPVDDPCPNYSPSLLPVDGGDTVLQATADRTADGCRIFFGTGPSR
ncbi:sialidase family protein [Prauserella alba]|uniref:sialidase family protein n=1 Tax=Prauserella alba TaxID=176898 RepID=UPI0020A51836